MTHLDNPILFLATANAGRSRKFYERAIGLAFVADEPPASVFLTSVAETTSWIDHIDHAPHREITREGVFGASLKEPLVRARVQHRLEFASRRNETDQNDQRTRDYHHDSAVLASADLVGGI